MPILAAGLLALLRYGLGSLFVVGESVAAALLNSTGADIAGTVQRLQGHPWQGIARAALGLAFSLSGSALAWRHAAAATLLATAGTIWALLEGYSVIAFVLGPAVVCGAVAVVHRVIDPAKNMV